MEKYISKFVRSIFLLEEGSGGKYLKKSSPF